MKFLLLLLSLSLHQLAFSATCPELIEKLTYFHHEETQYTDATVESVIDNKVAGFLTYTNQFDYHYVEVVRVEPEFRRQGIHTTLFKKFIDKEDPDEVHFMLADINRSVFLEKLQLHMFHPNVKLRAEDYITSILNTTIIKEHNIKFVLEMAGGNIPSGIALRRLGYEVKEVKLSTYDMRGKPKLKIHLEFRRKE